DQVVLAAAVLVTGRVARRSVSRRHFAPALRRPAQLEYALLPPGDGGSDNGQRGRCANRDAGLLRDGPRAAGRRAVLRRVGRGWEDLSGDCGRLAGAADLAGADRSRKATPGGSGNHRVAKYRGHGRRRRAPSATPYADPRCARADVLSAVAGVWDAACPRRAPRRGSRAAR